MKFNGWQRIGIVSSCVWTIGAAIYERSGQVSTAKEYHQYALGNCLPEMTVGCTEAAHKNYEDLLALDFGLVSNIVFVAIGPVLCVWVLVYLLVKIFHWIKAGF